MEMKWYTIFTRPNWEKKVTATLSRKKIINFCPLDFISKQQTGLKNFNTFSGYVFVKITENQVSDIKRIGGIQNFMYWMNKPAEISETEIKSIKDFLLEHSQVKMEKREIGFVSDVSYDDILPKENQAKLIHLNNNKIKVALPSLGYIMIAEFEKSPARLPVNENVISHSNSKFKFRYRIAR